MSYENIPKNVDESRVLTESTLPEVTETSTRGGKGLAVFIQDQTTGVLDLPFLRTLNTTTLAADTTTGSYTMTLAAGHGTVVGNTIELASTLNGSHFVQSKVLAVAANVITLDSPIPRVFTVADSLVSISASNMNVDGSGTPVIFTVNPLPNQAGDIIRLVGTLTDDSDMDFETFGGLPALARGIVLRIANGDGTYRNIINFKSNGEVASYSFDTAYFANNGGGIRGFQASMTWGGQSKHGVTVRLDGALGEELQMLVQDDLTGLTSMNWLAQGSEVQSI